MPTHHRSAKLFKFNLALLEAIPLLGVTLSALQIINVYYNLTMRKRECVLILNSPRANIYCAP